MNIILFLLFFAYGIFNISLGTNLEAFMSEFGLSVAEGGIFNIVFNVGGLIGMVFSIFLLPRFNKLMLIAVTFLIYSLVSFLSGFTVLLPLFLVMLIAAGMLSRLYDTGLNAVMPVINPQNTGFYVNFLHASYAVGSLAGPIIITAMLGYISWHGFYVIFGVFCFVLTFFLFVVKRRYTNNISGDERKASDMSAVENTPYKQLFTKKIILLIILTVLYCGHQYGISNWYRTYLINHLGSGESIASIALSLFWVGILISRIVCGVLSRKLKPDILIKAGSILAAVFLAIAVFSQHETVTIVCVLLCSLFNGAMNPLAMSSAYDTFPKATGRVSVLINMSIVLGAVFLPTVMGFASESLGIFGGMVINVGCLIVLAVLALFLRTKAVPESA